MAAEGSSGMLPLGLGTDEETTLKYLQGEISFEEYSALLLQNSAEEETEGAEIGLCEEEVVATELSVTEEQEKLETEKEDVKKGAENIQEEKRRKGRPQGPITRLPKHLQGLMGEANLRFARGDTEDAIKMCMEVVRTAPRAPEPFQTLGMIYEEMGDMNKALQFSLIAAHLNPKDAEEWQRLAEMSLEMDNVQQAVTCYNKAIKADPRNLQLHYARCDIYEQLGDQRKVVDNCQLILSVMPDDEGKTYLKVAYKLTKLLHSLGETEKAKTTMVESVQKHPLLATPEDINYALDLYILQKEYLDSIKMLIQFCGVRLKYSSKEIVSTETPKKKKVPTATLR